MTVPDSSDPYQCPAPTGEAGLRPIVRKVALRVEASARVANKLGSDIYAHILWLRLDGHSIEQIAKAVGLSTDTVGDLMTLWQSQVEVRFGPDFVPKKRNPRRWGNRPNRRSGASPEKPALPT